MGQLILLAFYVWLIWISYRDTKDRTSVSWSVWIVVIWLFLHGTRPLESWFGLEGQASRDEGSPLEATVNTVLIAAGLSVLLRRGIQWGAVLTGNVWLAVFYLFWILSITWSDYPLITLKRLIKDFGYLIMALVLLTDKIPTQSIRAAVVRFSYICIPLSVIWIRYFPSLGREFVGYSKSTLMYVGVSTHKNVLGNLILASALFVLWELLEQWKEGRVGKKRLWKSRVSVLAMCWYLLLLIDSQTSFICALLGSILLITLFKIPSWASNPGRIELAGIVGGTVIGLVNLFIDVKEVFLESVSRDPTLTTRTDIWPILIEFQDNPLLGQGFNSFWAGERLVELQAVTFGIIQAHNGYIETYLNGGIIGVGLLGLLILGTYFRIRRHLITGIADSHIRLVILIIAVIYNYSEASFNKIGPLWLVTVWAMMEYPSRPSNLRHMISSSR